MGIRIRTLTADGVYGHLHEPDRAHSALLLTHGAGGDCNQPLLVRVADEFASNGWLVLRYDLPFRQSKRQGPPVPGNAAVDRTGIRTAAGTMRELCSGPLLLGGHSYGGRQSSMLVADDPSVADALLLLSYPLHPPRKPAELRTAHFASLRTPVLFVHGTRDPFGSPAEMAEAVKDIPATVRLLLIDKAGHDLRSATAIAIREAVGTLSGRCGSSGSCNP